MKMMHFLPSFFGKQQDNLNNNVNIVENERHMGVDAQIGENESFWEEGDYEYWFNEINENSDDDTFKLIVVEIKPF